MPDFVPEQRYCIRCGRPFPAATILDVLCTPCAQESSAGLAAPATATAAGAAVDDAAAAAHRAGADVVGDPGATVVGDPGATVVGDPGATVVGDPGATVVGDPGCTVVGAAGAPVAGGLDRPPAQNGLDPPPLRSGAADEDVPLDLVPGTVIAGTYAVLDLLGRGGMGAVHRVRHLAWDVELAVKTPLPEIVAARGLDDFVAEASTWVDLGLHPNVATCHYVRILGGTPRVFAEYVAGGSLEHWVSDGRFDSEDERESLRRTIDAGVQIAWGLHHAHQRGLVHQDVKPANVLMTADGVAKVTDLGLSGATVRGRTPAYAAPEQRAGASVAAAADIYSFALTLLHLLWGGCTWMDGGVWADATPDALLAATPAGRRGAAFPVELAELIAACLAGEPDARPHDLSVVAAWLAILYEEVGGEPYAREQPKEGDLLAASLNNKALSLFDLGRRDEGLEALRESLATDPLFPEAVYNDGLLAWNRGEIGDLEVERRLGEIAAAAPRDWRPHYLLGELHQARQDIEAGRAALAEAGRRDGPAILLENAAARLTSAAKASAAVLSDYSAHTAELAALAFTAERHEALSVGRDGSVVIWDHESGDPLRAFALPLAPHQPSHLAIARDGSSLLYTPSTHERSDALTGPWLVETASGTYTDLGIENAEALAVSHDGRWALLQYSQGQLEPSKLAAHGALPGPAPHFLLVLWDLLEGRVHWQAALGPKYTVCADFSPDDTVVACSDSDGRLRTWHLGSARPAWCVEGLQDAGRFLRWFDDRGVLICHAAVQLQRTVTCLDARTGEHLFALEHESAVRLAVPARSGMFVVSATDSGQICAWNPRTRVLLRTFQLWGEPASALIADDAGTAAVGSSGGRLAVLRLPSADAPDLRPALARVVAPAETQERAATLERTLAQARSALDAGDAAAAQKALRAAREDPELVRHPAVMEIWHELAHHGRRVRLRDAWIHQTLTGHDDAVLALAVAPGGRRLLSGGGPPVVRMIRRLQPAVQQRNNPEDFRLRLWELPSGRLLHSLDGHEDTVRSVTFVDDERGASAADDGRILLWDLAGGLLERVLAATEVPPYRVEAVRAGRCLVSSDREDFVRLQPIDAPLGTREMAPAPDARSPFTPHPAASTLDASTVARATDDGGFKLWAPIGGGIRDGVPREGPGELGRLACSPDGRLLLAGRADGGVVLCEVASLEVRWEHAAHGPGMLGVDQVSLERPDRPFRRGETPAVAFSPEGRFAASGGADRSVRLWDVSTGECVATLQGHDDEVATVVFNSDGAFLASGGWDRRVIVWQLDWEYEIPEHAQWDDGARPYLDVFLELQRPTTLDGITPAGAPEWNDGDLDHLMAELGCRGFGFLSRDDVRSELERTAR